MRDDELLNRWWQGNGESGQTLVKRHYDSLFMFFWGKVDEQTSADLAQDTFETLCEGQGKFRADSSVRTYLFGIARWKLIDHLRKSRKRRARFDPLRDGIDADLVEQSISSFFAQRQQQALLVRGLRSLPLDDQLVLELKDYEALSAKEMAAIFEVPAGTMAGRISRARGRLRLAVQELATSTQLTDETLESLDSFFRGVRDAARDVCVPS
ncbi:MAG: sigma-70 family RNA polymerase sigma factor [Deltaproteobacteria bacterium]|nr:sigma-70 family RNA polymerase sigma factor [Deltaproteobacteria bacterium]